MVFETRFSTAATKNEALFDEQFLSNKLEVFNSIVNDSRFGFFSTINDQSLIDDCFEVFNKFQDKKYFVQVGTGGSSLGPEMLVTALKKDKERVFRFINNVDPEEMFDQLDSINLKESLFYIVSKSGGTAETMSAFAIICSLLEKEGITTKQYKDYFVFGTDPVKSQLLDLGKELGVDTLTIPSNVGGRFSVLTPVGYLPALFAGINVQDLVEGAKDKALSLLDEDVQSNPLLQTASFVMDQMEQGKNQTVLMPYSSKLRDFSFWFTQLWAESLGKKLDLDGNIIHSGLTPIPAYGATDQHSQMQLFMEGPNDKLLFMIEVENFANDFSLKSDFKYPAFQKLSNYNLSDLISAEFHGTLKALKENNREFIHITIDNNDERNMGALILFFESLTALMGTYLNINPFDQPGVELGKIYAYEFLEKLNS